MQLIKAKLEKKKREQVCKLSKDQIKALKEYRQQQQEFPFKVAVSDIEEQVKFLGFYKDDDNNKPVLLKKNHSATIKSILDCSQEYQRTLNQSGNYTSLLQSVDSVQSRDPMIRERADSDEEKTSGRRAAKEVESST